MGYIDSGKKEGAKLLAGGERVGDQGYFIEPTVFADVKDDMKIAQEEIFGPVMSIIKFKDSTKWSSAPTRPFTVWRPRFGRATSARPTPSPTSCGRARCGSTATTCSTPPRPFGGFKQSGIGRELGEYGLQQYTEVKTVTVKLVMLSSLCAAAWKRLTEMPRTLARGH